MELIRKVIFRPYRKGQGPTFTLQLFDKGVRREGRWILSYRLDMTGHDHAPLFAGDDFAPSPSRSIDSDESVADLMAFLTLKPGDTDSDYFDNYTPAQRSFCDKHAEALSCESDRRFGRD